MAQSVERFGLSCALATPFDESGQVEGAKLAAHVQWALSQGCDSVTAFGTTGEGPSLGIPARQTILKAIADSGIDLRQRVLGGVAASSLHEALDQTAILLDADCRAILLAPPFYFKGVSDDGLFAWFSSYFDKLGDRARDVILYNIPSVTAVTLSVDLISRLRTAYPQIITGVKDSSGDWAYTQKLLAAHKDIAILIGDERHLAQGVRIGAQGAISGMANVCPDRLKPMITAGQESDQVVRIVEDVLKFPVTPAVKALVAHRTGDNGWLRVRSPLMALSAADASRVASAYDAAFASKAA
ncbi:dihydrodipicolinate synthase family protein [Microvirga pudoricolor]|uniref:dihydrodipicolinate synthase family protein n=1 Tax=Microvirga pudoricolor TaxID=2778729 RepID=UPI00194DC11C|nr:dihydrodipicolinate synthase family protein [Microvirga pudoricolor]MBM6592494.1 dihydrodipicolinate synthase family protein [Microvirga pudoricolor]